MFRTHDHCGHQQFHIAESASRLGWKTVLDVLFGRITYYTFPACGLTAETIDDSRPCSTLYQTDQQISPHLFVSTGSQLVATSPRCLGFANLIYKDNTRRASSPGEGLTQVPHWLPFVIRLGSFSRGASSITTPVHSVVILAIWFA